MDIQSGRYVFGYDPGAAPERAGVEAARPRRPRNPANAFRELPAPTGPFPFRLDLGGVIGPEAIAEIAAAGKMVFHAVGDTGQKNHGGAAQDAVGYHLGKQSELVHGANRARFFYLLGDAIYFNGQSDGYEPQFYEPYRNYRGPIFAILGNHDGAVPPGDTALQAFTAEFCSEQPRHSPWAGESMRTTMTQPNCYWTLAAPFATIIGLYSNVPGELDHNATRQFDWLVGELRAAPADRFVIVAVHHPPYSRDTSHGGYGTIGDALDGAIRASNRVPHLVLNGHVHNYQRFERDMTAFGSPRATSYVVAGAGGYAGYDGLHTVDPGTALPGDVAAKAYEDGLPGFLRVTVTADEIHGEYFAVPRPPQHLQDPVRKDEFRIAR